MKILAGKILVVLVRMYLRLAPLFQDTAFHQGIVRWYRYRGIGIIQKYLPLFGNSVMISLTTRCQCSCRHCGVGHQIKTGGPELDSHKIARLIDEAHQLGAYSVYFFGGEPLLVPELFSYITYAKGQRLRTRLDTNGLLLDEEMVVKLKKAGLDEIGVSIDSLDEDTHDKNRGVEGTLKNALSGISYCNIHHLNCFISTVATKQNLANGDFQKIIQFAKSSGNRVRILSPVHCGRWENREDVVLSPAEVQRLRSFLELNTVFWDSELIDRKEAPFLCSAMARRTVYISPSGDVQPCCYLPVMFGNIKRESLITVLNRMRDSELFSEAIKSPECPTNSPNFQTGNGRTVNAVAL